MFCSMATIEPFNLIRETEYISNRPERIYEQDISVGEVYTMFSKLQHGVFEAARIPVLSTRQTREVGSFILSVALLNEDMQPVFEVEGTMDNGFWADNRRSLSVKPFQRQKQLVVESFFRAYDDGVPMDMLVAERPLEHVS